MHKGIQIQHEVVASKWQNERPAYIGSSRGGRGLADDAETEKPEVRFLRFLRVIICIMPSIEHFCLSSAWIRSLLSSPSHEVHGRILDRRNGAQPLSDVDELALGKSLTGEVSGSPYRYRLSIMRLIHHFPRCPPVFPS
jgi:hypothetical protein